MVFRHYTRISNPSYSSTNSKKVSEEIFKNILAARTG